MNGLKPFLTGMSTIKPFVIDIPNSTLTQIHDRVSAFTWHEEPVGNKWEYGTDINYMKDLCDYWLNSFNWREHEHAINQFPQFVTPVDGLDLHFIHEPGSGPSPQPLLLSHGWPGSVYEFLNVIELLAHPERFGGNADDAFSVVAPSLPGFGFSAKPGTPIGPRAIATLFTNLMTKTLGYDGFIAQGGDWGSVISGWIGFDHENHCDGIHLNMFGLRAMGAYPETDAEKGWARAAQKTFAAEGGYFQIQSTKPQTLSYAMMDSPVGVAAWIVEKFQRWGDVESNRIETAFSKDQLLANIMIYLVTHTFNTASWIYRAYADENSRFLPKGERIKVPVGVASFPKEFIPWPPRSFAEKVYNIVHWTNMPHGGHFAAMEQPQLFVNDLRTFLQILGRHRQPKR